MTTPDNTSNTIVIQMIHDKTTTISIEDSDLVTIKWHVQAGYKKGDPDYVSHSQYMGKENGKPVIKKMHMHRVIMSRILNRELTKSDIVDHKDGNTLNNCRDNLRLATPSQNAQNRKGLKNKSGYKGVVWATNNKNWVAHIKVNGKFIHLGVFDDPKEAYAVYCEAAKKYFGEFARIDNV